MLLVRIKRQVAVILSLVLAANLLFLASPAMAGESFEEVLDQTTTDISEVSGDDKTVNDTSEADSIESDKRTTDNSNNEEAQQNNTSNEAIDAEGRSSENQLIQTQDDPVSVLADPLPTISVEAHSQNRGWLAAVGAGTTAGTSGGSLRLEAIKINLTATAPQYNGSGISYSSHVQNVGNQNAVTNNMISGTTGKSIAIEAITIKLTGNISSDYSIYYRMHVANIGWMNWAKDGAWAGTKAMSYRAEAVQVVLVKKPTGGSVIQPPIPNPNNNSPVPFLYSDNPSASGGISIYGHSQDVGNTAAQGNYGVAGTTGRSKRLEAVYISLAASPDANIPAGSIKYSAHVQNVGWQDWVKDGALAGSTGKSRRLEAIKIELEGDIANTYSIYYRAHVENFGWLGWAKDGEVAGSSGLDLRTEAIQIALMLKTDPAPGSGDRHEITPIQVSSNAELNAAISRIIYFTTGTDRYTIFKHVASYAYYSRGVYPSYAGWQEQYALSMIRDGGGNCYSFACLFHFLAKAAGYNTAVISGQVPSSGGGRAAHGWVELYENGNTYICDPDGQHEVPRYNWYMRQYGDAPTTYYK